MRDGIDDMLRRCGGAASRSLLFRQGLSRHALDGELRSGALVVIAPATYCRPWDADDVAILERGALMSVGHPVALSHLSALRRWELLAHRLPVHVTVRRPRCPRSTADIVAHRVDRFPSVVRHSGLITTSAAQSVVDSWPLLAETDRRGPAIRAARERLLLPEDLRISLERRPRLPGRRELLGVIDLLAAGCESELEMWGHRRVFDHPGLRHGVAQRVVRAGGRSYRLDLAYERERTAIEMDGAQYHSSTEQREHDMRRDAALAALGWLTLRFSHRRLHDDVAGCRRDTLAVLAGRP